MDSLVAKQVWHPSGQLKKINQSCSFSYNSNSMILCTRGRTQEFLLPLLLLHTEPTCFQHSVLSQSTEKPALIRRVRTALVLTICRVTTLMGYGCCCWLHCTTGHNAAQELPTWHPRQTIFYDCRNHFTDVSDVPQPMEVISGVKADWKNLLSITQVSLINWTACYTSHLQSFQSVRKDNIRHVSSWKPLFHSRKLSWLDLQKYHPVLIKRLLVKTFSIFVSFFSFFFGVQGALKHRSQLFTSKVKQIDWLCITKNKWKHCWLGLFNMD